MFGSDYGTSVPPNAYPKTGGQHMILFLLWCLLFLLSWPLAIAALLLYPLVWVLLLPFRLLGIAVHGALALVAAIILLPVRIVRGIA